MRRYTVAMGALVLALAVLLGGWLRPWQLVSPAAASKQPVTGQNVAIGSPAPSFTLPSLDGEASVSLADLRGRVVVVNFWATWCRYCVHEMPLLERMHRADPSVAVLGVDNTLTENSIASVGRYARRLGVTYPILLDVSGAVISQYQVHSYPTTFFVNANGTITGAVVGELTAPLLRAELARAGAKGAV